MAFALEKASNNAYMWVDHIDTLVKEDFTKFLNRISKNSNSVSKVIETAQGYVNNIRLYYKLSAANSNKIAIMIRDTTKAEQLAQKVEMVQDEGATTNQRKELRRGSPSA
ncbi:hypothetical protein BASA60_005827 [Batrachochytrium salamandrivorans]|nr:hypothetical protein BASA60_005827 [Batrachochytrium salamandrivorans]